MKNLTIVGAQWGDEGKGKIVDYFSDKFDVVLRFQGGNNAGHTLQIKNNIYKLNLIPSGVVRGKMSIIGNGVVLDPWALSNEINKLSSHITKVFMFIISKVHTYKSNIIHSVW